MHRHYLFSFTFKRKARPDWMCAIVSECEQWVSLIGLERP